MSSPHIVAWGPWLGVPKERQHLCAVDGCEDAGAAHECPADSTRHFHGCVHYEHASEALYVEHKAKLRQGWGLLCDKHYALVRDIMGRSK